MSLNDLVNQMSKSTNPLLQLVAEERVKHVGFTIHASYSEMVVMTNDIWRCAAGGVPMNGYLLATSLNAADYNSSTEIDRRVIVLRIAGRTDIATDNETVNAIIRHFQDNPDTTDPSLDKMEPLSKSLLQWSGVKSKILGTFHLDIRGQLVFGADVEDFFASRQMRVWKPGPAALKTIVNFIDPVRLARAKQDADEMKMKRMPAPFQIGRVRFTSSRHMGEESDSVPVTVFPGDFLARRTAVFGMTRTGKSNTTKTMVSAVLLSAIETDLAIGQLILDINGEYSNANGQDKGSLADAFFTNTIRYRAMEAPGFLDLRVNFYESFEMGLDFIANNIRDEGGRLSEDLQTFISLDLQEPTREGAEPDAEASTQTYHQAHTRWRRRVSMYQSILFRSGYEPKPNFRVTIDVHKDVLDALCKNIPGIDPTKSGTNQALRVKLAQEYFGFEGGTSPYRVDLETAKKFWSEVRDVEMALEGYKMESGGIRVDGNKKKWLDAQEGALLSVLVGRSGKNDTLIRSTNAIRNAAIQFHSSVGSSHVGRDIYNHLKSGRIVIADLSVGPPTVRERMAERIAQHIFFSSADIFTSGEAPPKVAIYVEEAHNLIGKKADLNETWPRIAKEGAKYGIALVYATQEPSSIHPNILANTENFFVTHLNNDAEIRALASYYDFADFAESLKRCQDVGFARVKTLSSNFTVSTQIDHFKVEEAKAKFELACRTATSNWFSPIAPLKTR
jgi:hypothetical protein